MGNHEISHHGIKGMRWGVTRNQKKNGTLTSDERQGKEQGLNKAKSTLDETGKIIKSLKDIDDSLRKESAKTRTDISKMSDEELKARVQRLNLEKNYSNLTEAPVSKGRQYARGILEIGGSVAGIGASSVTIALALKQLKG